MERSSHLLSMTGFGRAVCEESPLFVTCEIRSVNHRGLDVKIRLPRELYAWEAELVHRVKRAISRGRVDAVLTFSHPLLGAKKVTFDTEAARGVMDSLKEFAKDEPRLGKDLMLGDLLTLRELFVFEETSDWLGEVKPVAERAFELALQDLLAARKEEGANLFEPISALLRSSESLVLRLSQLSREVPGRHHVQLLARLKELLHEQGIDPVRLAQEAAFLADKSDVSEELDRLSAHFKHFQTLCQSEQAAGRKLDFLCQEMFREANTIGSKCADTSSSHLVVELKAQIERLREQVQNIE